MQQFTKTSAAFAKAMLGLGAASLCASAQADHDTPKILKTCEEANVRLYDLAVGENSGVRTFYQGNVQILQIDQVEPAAASSGIVILAMIPGDGMGDRLCMAATGFSYLDLDKATSSYDSSEGLKILIPAMDYNGMESVPGKPLIVIINLGKSEIEATR